VIALTDLLEAEGRTLRINLMRAALGVALVLAAVLLVCVGLCLCLWAVYLSMSVYWGATGAAFFVAALILAAAGLLAWTATRLNH